MTELQQAEKRVGIAQDAIDLVTDLANQDRKVSGEKTINGHYTKALQELKRALDQANHAVDRVKARQ